MTDELLELPIEAEPGFLEYERHMRRVLVQAFGIPARKSIDFRAAVISPLYQAALDSIGFVSADLRPFLCSGNRGDGGPPVDHGSQPDDDGA